MKKIYLITALCLSALVSKGQDASGDPPKEIVKYFFVELITNPDRPELPKSQVDSIQRAHMVNIGNMAKNKTLMLAGPFEKGGGIFILKVNSLAEAEALAKKDPAVSAGRLLTEIRPWYTAKGMFASELNQ